MATYQIKYRDGTERQVEGDAIIWRKYVAEIVKAPYWKAVAFVALDLIKEIVVCDKD